MSNGSRCARRRGRCSAQHAGGHRQGGIGSSPASIAMSAPRSAMVRSITVSLLNAAIGGGLVDDVLAFRVAMQSQSPAATGSTMAHPRRETTRLADNNDSPSAGQAAVHARVPRAPNHSRLAQLPATPLMGPRPFSPPAHTTRSARGTNNDLNEDYDPRHGLLRRAGRQEQYAGVYEQLGATLTASHEFRRGQR